MHSEGIEEKHAQPNKQKKESKPFGLPLPLTEKLLAMKMSKEQIHALSFDEVLDKVGVLEGKSLQKTLQTIIKTSRAPALLLKRVQTVTGASHQAQGSPVILAVNTVLGALEAMALYEGDLQEEDSLELLRFLLWVRREAEEKTAKLIAHYALEHLSLSEETRQAALIEHMTGFLQKPEDTNEEAMEKHILLFSGASHSKTRLREIICAHMDALLLLAEKCTQPIPIWQQILEVYALAGKSVLPMESIRRLGWATLRSFSSEEDILSASSIYLQSMRKKLHELAYAQFFISYLAKDLSTQKKEDALKKLLHYLFVERSICGPELCPLGIAQLPLSLVLSVLEEESPEKINTSTMAPLFRNMIRAQKNDPESLQKLFDYIHSLTTKCKQRRTALKGLLHHIHWIQNPEDPKPHTA
ncbi:hypothetical protein NEFER03_2210 [Nematocida sp. LUAm3]|nr:hypothetical protein NEFER03_0630 [Nematocida sp. LUAm3]KAI5171855.1 hypothetical protein NEFER03_1120 [Nematocida sp. LUAm3]KAI5173263.1 hypothetical protein NEFER03_2210 [Nematocida sp. LUAm3]KAI5176430.1 hypothetical protein NEFER02_2193 [Nematocida sp. LUAm2]KAI5179287.1 hypothetical protein NEFER01_2136 [Nematocida sp. LUAm1]